MLTMERHFGSAERINLANSHQHISIYIDTCTLLCSRGKNIFPCRKKGCPQYCIANQKKHKNSVNDTSTSPRSPVSTCRHEIQLLIS